MIRLHLSSATLAWKNCHGSKLRGAALIAGWKSNRVAKLHAAMGFPALGIWTGSAALLFTRGILQDWVLSFKFGSRQSLSFLLGRLFALGMIGQGVEKDFSCMVPIPLHQKRLRSRGFNQSLLLAHQLLKNIKAKPSLLRPRVLRRVRETIPQTELPYPERLKNPDDAFAVGDSLPAGTILLIDDVMTTGSTLNAAARILKASGAERVSSWVLCRSVIGNDSRDLFQ